MSLLAPARVTVEIREEPERPGPLRRFRLSRAIGPDRVDLAKPLDLAPGTPVRVRFRLPAGERAVTAVGVLVGDRDAGPATVDLCDVSEADRAALLDYVKARLVGVVPP